MKRISLILSVFLLMTHGLDVSAQRRRAGRATGDSRPGPSFHSAGPKLAETELYELYEAYSVNPRVGCFNSPGDSRAAVSVVFKVDADYIITDDDAYKRRFEKEILPVIKQRCSSVTSVSVFNYIKGVRIDRDLNEHGYDDQTFTGMDRQLNNFVVKIDEQGVLHYTNHHTVKSLADLRRERRSNEEREAKAEAARVAEAREKDRIANLEYTADGKLKIAGIKHKKLFQQIYDEEFLQLSLEATWNDYLPYLMYSGHISVYSDMCRSSLSPSAVKVDIYDERYLRTEYSAFRQTEYYERYLAQTVYMEPEYEAAFRLSVPTFLAKIFESWRREPGDFGIHGYFLKATLRALPLGLDSRQLIANNGCKSPSVIKFTDNLHNYVTGNWSTQTADGYKYIEKGDSLSIIRHYGTVPPTFSPEFPKPDGKHKILLLFNERDERPGLHSLSILRFDFWANDPWNLEKLPSPLPQYFKDAAKEKKYYIAICNYSPFAGSPSLRQFIYWHAKEPLPPAQLQDFTRSVIRPPRDRCPTTNPGN